MKSVTIDQVISWGPCATYGKTDKEIREKLEQLANGRESMTALEILELDIPQRDIQWAILREELIDAKNLHEFACWCAGQALLGEREAGREPHLNSWKAIEVKRRWIKGEATDKELNAAWAAAGAAAWAAAGAAAGAAARDAAWAAAGAAARAKQNNKLKEILEGTKGE
ncbi:MAG TPA: hypothetical protein VMW91_01455 [Desulfosporosinus sp.]|nr:hypothetical protein [Desulfosporosinus sp.]